MHLLYRLGLIGGLVPMIGGLLLFLGWWMGRAIYAVNLTNISSTGVVWIFISFLLGVGGLVSILIVLVKGGKRFYRRAIIALVILIANLPVGGWMILKQDDLSQRAYVKIYNHTGQNLNLAVGSVYFTKDLGKLHDGRAQVNFYYPQYRDSTADESVAEVYPVTLIANQHEAGFPLLRKGECAHLDLDANFTLHEHIDDNR